MELNRNDVVLVRNSRREKWKLAVFDRLEMPFHVSASSNGRVCVDGCGNCWSHYVPLKGSEDLQDTSLPEDGWQEGDLCVWKDASGYSVIGFYYSDYDDGMCLVSREPIKQFFGRPECIQIPKTALRRPEKEWYWWNGDLYREYSENENCIPR